MSTSSTTILSIGSGERKRCSNMAPVRKLRNLAWINARRLPGVRCSTLNTECRSLLCLMTMPGRNCVAGIAMQKTLLTELVDACRGGLEAAGGSIQMEPRGELLILARSEEHTSELQSRFDLVCRLLLEKKKKKYST